MYKFPLINTIDDVLPAIEGRKEFVVAERDGYKIINYNVMFSDTFPPIGEPFAALRRECRGIIFDNAGNIIRRPLHKFFNLNEREESLASTLDFTESHIIYEKMDGSMIAPFIVDDKLIWGTKMAALEFHNEIERYLSSFENVYKKFVESLIYVGYTPIFEWTAPQNRIVVNHKEEALTLLAVRNIHTGEYSSQHILEELTHNFCIPLVKSYDSVTDIDKFIEDTRNLVDVEGFVIAWESGERHKSKCDWYVQIHNAKEKILQERNVLAMILDNTIDDVLAFLPDEDKERINAYMTESLNSISEYCNGFFYIFTLMKIKFGNDRKAFSLEMVDLSPIARQLCFKFWDMHRNDKLEEMFLAHCLDLIKKHLNNTAKFEEIKKIFFPKVIYTPY